MDSISIVAFLAMVTAVPLRMPSAAVASTADRVALPHVGCVTMTVARLAIVARQQRVAIVTVNATKTERKLIAMVISDLKGSLTNAVLEMENLTKRNTSQ